MTEATHDTLPPQGRYQLQVDHDAIYAPEESAARRWRWIGSALLLVLLALGALCPLLRGEMLRTDKILLSSRPALDRLILDPTPPALDGYEYPGTRFTRFAATISPARYLLRTEQRLFDRQSARGFRFVGILLHAAAAIALFAIVQRLSLPWPWLTAALYTVTPLAAGAIAPFVHQPILLSVVLSLLATLVYLRWSGIDRREVESHLRPALPSARWLLVLITILLWIAATLTHSFAAVFPAIWAILAGWRIGRVASWTQRISLPTMILIGIAYAVVIRIGFSGEMVGTTIADLARRVGLLPTIAWSTVRLGLWPSDASLVGAPATSAHLHGIWLIAGAAIAVAISLIWLTRKKFSSVLHSPAAAVACFSLFAFAAVAAAPEDAGEVGPFEGALLLPLVVVLIAISTGLAEVVKRWQARRPPRVEPAVGSDVELSLFTWRSVGLGFITVMLSIAAALPTGIRSFAFAGQKPIAERDLERNPDARRAVLAAVSSQASENRWFFAEQLVERQVARLPSDIDLRLLLGQLYVLHERYHDAIVTFGAANKFAINDPRPFEGLGAVLERKTSFDAAEKAFRIAIDLNAKTKRPGTRAQAALGELLLNRGDLTNARAAFDASVLADPDGVDGLLGQARCAIASHDPIAADRVLTHLLVAYANDPDVVTRLALTIAGAGDAVNAQRLMEYVIRLSPSASALNNLGTLLARQNRFADAIRVFRRAVEIDPSFTSAKFNLNLAIRNSAMPTPNRSRRE